MEPSAENILRTGKELAAEIRRLRAEAEGLRAETQRLRVETQRLWAEAKQRGEHLLWLVSEIRRQYKKDYHAPMQEAIRALHRCRSQHVASFAVRKVFEGNTVWDGMVEEFKLTGHRQAKVCYAWWYTEWGKTHVFSVLKLPPIDSPQRAVQLALAARGEYQSNDQTKPDGSAAYDVPHQG